MASSESVKWARVLVPAFITVAGGIATALLTYMLSGAGSLNVYATATGCNPTANASAQTAFGKVNVVSLADATNCQDAGKKNVPSK